MRYAIDIGTIENAMFKGNSFTHNTGNTINLVPYKTNFNPKVLEFKGILGELSRLLLGQESPNMMNRDILFDNIRKRMSSPSTEKLIEFIRELYFDTDGNMFFFHPKVFSYLHTETKDQKDIANFLYQVFCTDEVKQSISKIYEDTPDLLVKLIIDHLPSLKLRDTKLAAFKNYVPYVVNVFQQDFTYLLRDGKSFVQSFEKLFKFYYFYYVSQMVIQLNKMMEADLSQIQPLYFLLDWETASKSRVSYKQGWKVLDSAIANLFPHTVCLEFINYNKEGMNNLSYPEWMEAYVQHAAQEKKEEISNQLDGFIEKYKEWAGKLAWERLDVRHDTNEDIVKQKIYELFRHIEYQFKNGTRKSAYNKYCNWFSEYCKSEFLKRRGSLGYMLNMTQDYLLFLTQLCIKEKEKMRLHDLFEEFERRGVYCDIQSKEKIVQLFEKLNLLEKKSDSGDAQYVRAIL